MATEDYILQQACCTAVRPHGLSETIALKWPTANPYAKRHSVGGNKNWATLKDRPTPGTVTILQTVSGSPKVICLFGQYHYGRLGAYNKFDPLKINTPDSRADRLQYFRDGLEALGTLLVTPASIAVPYRIGCGMAGGDWDQYAKALCEFGQKHPHIRLVVYHLTDLGC